MAFGIEVKLKGTEKLMQKLRKLPDKLQRKAIIHAANAAGGTLKKKAKIKAPKETGLLRQSLGVKRVSTKNKMIFAVRVQPRSGWKRAVGRKISKSGKLLGRRKVSKKGRFAQIQIRNPQFYAHLQELPVKHINQGGVNPNRFLVRSFNSVRGRMLNHFRRQIKKFIDGEKQ